MTPRILLLILALAFVRPEAVRAAMYSFVDKNGVTHYTNVPGDRRYKVRQSQDGDRQKQRMGRVTFSRKEVGVTARKATKQYTAPSSLLSKHINRAAVYYKVDPLLIRAIIKTESDFNQYAISSQGAQGLMQLMPGTARDLDVIDPFDARQNINGGTRYFRRMLDSYHGNVKLSLAAYNAGPGRVKAHGTIPRIPETRAYVAKVLRYYRAYQRGLASLNRINVRQLVTVN